jgi:hypothetical protein
MCLLSRDVSSLYTIFYRQDCFCLEICYKVTRLNVIKRIVSRRDVKKSNVSRNVLYPKNYAKKTETVWKFYINVTWILDPRPAGTVLTA